LSFEVNLPEFAPDGQECVGMLDRLAAGGTFNYAAGDYETGLALHDWLAAQEFSQVLARCEEKSIEVFWKTPVTRGAKYRAT
ncbi:MAG: hypothetical protein WAU89_17330, partial [Candidatus Acidiferrales bacterium]